MDGFGACFVLVLLMVVAGLVGSLITDSEWRSDCQRLGMTQSHGKVYECKVRG